MLSNFDSSKCKNDVKDMIVHRLRERRIFDKSERKCKMPVKNEKYLPAKRHIHLIVKGLKDRERDSTRILEGSSIACKRDHLM
jgi:hypothetical protein